MSRYLHRGTGAAKGWASRRQREREERKEMIDALVSARNILRGPRKISEDDKIEVALEKIKSALWRLGVHR